MAFILLKKNQKPPVLNQYIKYMLWEDASKTTYEVLLLLLLLYCCCCCYHDNDTFTQVSHKTRVEKQCVVFLMHFHVFHVSCGSMSTSSGSLRKGLEGFAKCKYCPCLFCFCSVTCSILLMQSRYGKKSTIWRFYTIFF